MPTAHCSPLLSTAARVQVPADFISQPNYPFKDEAAMLVPHGWVVTMLAKPAGVAAFGEDKTRLTTLAQAEVYITSTCTLARTPCVWARLLCATCGLPPSTFH